MEITSVQVFPINGSEGKLVAFARIIIDDALMLSSLRIYNSVNGLFVSFPADLSQGGEDYRHYYCPIKKEFRQEIQNKVLGAYDKVLIDQGLKPEKRKLTFASIDRFDRPLFKLEGTKLIFGSTDILFNFEDTEEEVLKRVKLDDLCYFGTKLGCEPEGGKPLGEGVTITLKAGVLVEPYL